MSVTFNFSEAGKTNGKFWRKGPVPTWTTLGFLGQQGAIRALAWWVFLVPIVALCFGKLPDELHLDLFGRNLVMVLDFPFSWTILYFAGVSAMIGGLIFKTRCPKIIVAAPCDTHLSEMPKMRVAELGAEVMRTENIWLSNYNYVSVSDAATNLWSDYGGPEGLYSIEKEVWLHPTSGIERLSILCRADAGNLLHHLRVIAEWSRFWSRAGSAFCYALTAILLIIVFMQNFVFVIRVLW